MRRSSAATLSEGEVFESVREAALNSLDRATQSRKSLESKLLRRGYPDNVVAAVLDRLAAAGLIDDAEYARMLVDARFERGQARRAIKAELSRKGIGEEISVRVLAGIDDDLEQAAADRMAVKLFTRYQGVDDTVRLRRTYAALSRRGYPPETINRAFASAIGPDRAASLLDESLSLGDC